jgi:beta-N-acetylhexosaminidase
VSKKKKIIILALVVFLILVGVLLASFLKLGSWETIREFKILPTPDPVGQKIEKMSLEEKVGRLFVVGFVGESIGPKTEAFFREHYFANFLLGEGNIKNEEQARKLIGDLEAMATGSALIGVDQEGGKVSRIEFGGIDLTSQAKIKDENQALEIGKNRGKILADLGINLVFAPVMEVVRDENSYLGKLERAFLGDEIDIFELGKAMIEGYRQEKVVCIGKHFPGGLGRGELDPHQILPTLKISEDELERDILPFKKLIEASSLEGVMMTHILYSKIDSEFPASLSAKIIGGILRGELKFEGIVLTDDLAMKGITSSYSLDEAAVKAFLAGADLLMITGGRENQDKAYKAILEAVNKGEVSLERVDESVGRILRIMNNE